MNKYETLSKQIDWKSLLISSYRTLNLSEDEVMVILVASFCLEQGETLITPELLSLKMNFDYKKVSTILTQLVNKSLLFVDEDSDGKLYTSLNGIKQLLIDDFIKDSSRKKEVKDSSKNVYSAFENEFGRPLSFTEIEIIKSWLDSNYSEAQIILALKEASSAKVKNLRYIDKILLSWSQQAERNKEGYTTISEGWRKDMGETLKTANFDVEKDENK